MIHRMTRLTRRMALLALGGAAFVAGLPARAAARRRTPPQTPGPFYPPPAHRFADTDWDLVKVEGAVRAAGGEVMLLEGRVLEADGTPVPGAIVEIWQCDANGRYLHRGDRGDHAPRDAGFQGYGVVRADGEGRYRFRTIRPVAYPGRTPHIHARVRWSGGGELITQIYLDGERLNGRDFLFARLGERAGETLIAPRPGADGVLEAGFDFVV